MFSYNGDVTVNGVTYPDGAQAMERMGDYNCNHYKTDVILGVSQPGFDRDWLAEQKAGDAELVEFEGRKKTRYEWTKAQRRIENEIRTQTGIKTMATVAGDKAFARQANEKIDFYRKKYEELCEKTGLQPTLERMGTVKAKTLTGAGGGGIIGVQGGKIMNINNIDSPIEQRNTGKGNPNAILLFDRPLNSRQQKLLEALPEYDSRVVVKKKDVNMRDLSAMTAVTGHEFALFTKGKERLVVRGNTNTVNIDIDKATELKKQGYKWSGHTHPGVGNNCLVASPGDKDILKCFNQEMSVIYNSKGQYETFEKE